MTGDPPGTRLAIDSDRSDTTRRDHGTFADKANRAIERHGVAALVTLLIAYWGIVISIQRQYVLDPWITGDWLVNYSDGFVRRGLVGEFSRRLYYATAISPI